MKFSLLRLFNGGIYGKSGTFDKIEIWGPLVKKYRVVKFEISF